MSATDPVTGHPMSKQRLRLWLHMLKTARFVENELRERMRVTYQSTLPRFDVMAMLDRTREGLLMSQLSQQLMVSNGNVTGIIDRLVQDGYVVRVSVKGDKRATLVRLTPKGIEKFAEMAAEHERWIDELMDNVQDQDIEHFIDALNHIRKDHQHD
ncbi:DNA-binding MarR family transcriptional regulator [Maritalea mobilis]|uniref:DNA-binding MarR family transcriptional regulator n=1 Tax=Maritalea mobilis TaxID=483324 RepID=A0A4R6VPJ4_9HYPH|nr:MarR family transcriptional regulator [Maritalea mobilis]TDQ64160.1 DNA-binding MarR family transcriptional regulator [Maritalea mobilis]